MQPSLYERFLKPANAFRGKPLWSWNGKLDRERLLEQIRAFREMGFGGFYMHSRVGLQTEYLGEEWMELTRACAEEAQRLGMEAWLYDEDRWPSGTAGGMATREPQYRLKFIRADLEATDAFCWTEHTVAAFYCRLDGVNVYDCKQLHRSSSLQALPAEEGVVLAFRTTEMASTSFYNGSTYLDTLNLEATEHFLALTHEKYSQSCGDLFGGHIQGIFTDEPHRGSLLDGFGITNPDKERHVPWTYDLFERFQDAFGYDLLPRLPELFFRLNGQVVSQVKWHYVELLQRMFLENFAEPVQRWCKRHGLRLTGHVLHEDSLTAQTAMSGSVMRYYEYMEEPGIDVLTEGNRCYWIAKQLASVARQLNKRWLFSELYGATGWQLSFEGHKAVGNWQALFGINARSHHLAWYTMEGESKRDFPGTIGPQSAWWREYESVETYFSRIGAAMSEGTPVCDVLALNPVESVWSQVYCGWSSMLATASPEVIAIERNYQELFHWLTGSQIDFDYGDEHLLAKYGSVEADASGVPVLRVGAASYRVVIVAGMLTIRLSTLRLLHAFLDAGGQVVVAGSMPGYVDALPSGDAVQLLDRAMVVEWREASVAQACAPSLRIRAQAHTAATDEPVRDLLCHIRQIEDGHIVMFLNVDRDRWQHNVRLRVNLHGAVEQWDALTGQRSRIAVDATADGMEMVTDFPPSGERLYYIREQADEAVPLQPVGKEAMAGQWNGPFSYRLSEPNVCVLDRATYRIGDGEWQAESELLRVDRALRDHYRVERRNNKMVQPWYARTHGLWPDQPLGRIALQFRFLIDPGEGLLNDNGAWWHLAMEHPANVKIFVNDQPLLHRAAGATWVDPCFELLPVPLSMLREGDNRILLETTFHERTDLEAVYLLGDFGVMTEGVEKRITSLPGRLAIGDLTRQGLPFYGGMIAYHLETAGRQVTDGDISPEDVHLLRLPAIDGACAKVVSANGPARTMPWTPYEADITEEVRSGSDLELQLFLTRRNTFGPLHMVPARSNAYSPEHFHTSGERYTDGYELWPAGIPAPPQHFVRRHISAETSSDRGEECSP
ncbi:MAG: hypothetical protein J7639_30290 [Paenibacillaceae bacterium]|nr:hypothetical protein [Paenibacillaceae bacterium]